MSESSPEPSSEPEHSSLLLTGSSLVGLCRAVEVDVGGIPEMARLESLVGRDMCEADWRMYFESDPVEIPSGLYILSCKAEVVGMVMEIGEVYQHRRVAVLQRGILVHFRAASLGRLITEGPRPMAISTNTDIRATPRWPYAEELR